MIRMLLLELALTKIGATPLLVHGTFSTYVVLIPQDSRLRMVLSAKISSPTLVNINTFELSLAAATAWFAPFPPQPILNAGASRVSPSLGIWLV
ncbi:Uncharacterised protein [Salmonella enterica subsp. enterica serovar Bovismorbificans]|uniref:Uncharacterized protein n=1 Tax=Salmonella enterica subsp. enterica serovar Bovismorbificans TaxID=58097 RepID=A0A655BPS8_SALET|nr:Uncharacterised protein [Salmonella enterica subsp. enterica serovar Bovismorbificans]